MFIVYHKGPIENNTDHTHKIKFLSNNKTKVGTNNRKIPGHFLNIINLFKTILNNPEFKEGILRTFEKHLTQ